MYKICDLAKGDDTVTVVSYPATVPQLVCTINIGQLSNNSKYTILKMKLTKLSLLMTEGRETVTRDH